MLTQEKAERKPNMVVRFDVAKKVFLDIGKTQSGTQNPLHVSNKTY